MIKSPYGVAVLPLTRNLSKEWTLVLLSRLLLICKERLAKEKRAARVSFSLRAQMVPRRLTTTMRNERHRD